MSNTDSFIDEVTEEVRRDKLFGLMRKYGWVAVLAVVLIVGGAAYREWSRAQDTAAAQAFGDAILAALDSADAPARVIALQDIAAPSPESQAVLDLIIAAEQTVAEDVAGSVETLRGVALNTDTPEIYRQIANFKALTRADSVLTPAERRIELEALAQPGSPLRLLSEEQLALLDLSQGNRDAAMDRFRRILEDAEVTTGLRRRASQMIVALGGDLSDA